MVFSSSIFLFIFLPLVLFFYFIVRAELRNFVLLAFSLIFYAWGEPRFVLLMLFSILLNYCFGLLVHHYDKRKNMKVTFLIMAVVGNILLLSYFKYISFFTDILNQTLHLSIHVEPIPLPIGISFYTFQAMSYVIDIYRKDGDVQKNPLNLALYISIFPQLIAGPIVRYNIVAEQIKTRIHSFERFTEGIQIFVLGLAKKILIANQVGFVADKIFALPPSEISVGTAWIGIIAYTLQIYFDFSGYSDMAIGLGKMFGFDFPKNFNYPYISKSISEFWRRWHITLGSWFRDYIYIPLGGNRVSKLANYRNLFIVWGLTGLWHGASWTFIAWGLYYGFIISIEKAGFEKILNKLWKPLQHAYVLIIVMIGWVFFRADNFSYSFQYLKAMFGMQRQSFIDDNTMLYIHEYIIVFIIAFIAATPILKRVKNILELAPKTYMFTMQVVRPILLLTLFMISIMYLINSTYNPFIYFRF
ncbi:MBOAT family O-acyltransferase [Bacillus paramycoides]|uniref:MBOAT family O-acyltransferase n=1 Tax=Bacillus paramycoides TaxID=2026194 RepID=UPI002E1B42DA|nr:MBOAT family O-acyltransferase [Bacillus paramycoides]MED1107218.1 MBOAT family O-acyltransferase [Bacillus paramycoides]